MITLLLARFGHSVLVIVFISILSFVLVHYSGDPVSLYMPLNAPESYRSQLRTELGLDRPLHYQILGYLKHALKGDFGISLRFAEPALPLVLKRLPATIRLSFWALVIALALGIPLGIVGATQRGRLADHLATVVAVAGQSIPAFWIGIVLILVFSVHLKWLPMFSTEGKPLVLLPAITLSAYPLAVIARVLRSSLLEVLREDYIRTAHAKGLGRRRVLFRHALRNASLPTLTVVGIQLGALLAGVVVIETVFGYPGMGLLAIRALRNRDLPVVQAFVVLMGAIVVLINLIVDLAYAILDPRIRHSRASA